MALHSYLLDISGSGTRQRTRVSCAQRKVGAVCAQLALINPCVTSRGKTPPIGYSCAEIRANRCNQREINQLRKQKSCDRRSTTSIRRRSKNRTQTGRWCAFPRDERSFRERLRTCPVPTGQ